MRQERVEISQEIGAMRVQYEKDIEIRVLQAFPNRECVMDRLRPEIHPRIVITVDRKESSFFPT
jgi:hypothetical protein